ncbi:MAG: Gfo/Idh/MocA family protein, partial [Pseudonocardiaceae bacterium]
MRFGFIGLGRATRVFHLPALTQIDGAEVVGGYDESAMAREAWQREAQMHAFDTVDDLLERSGAEVIVVATPPASHAELCIRALESGAHVICEKPFATTVDEADRILAAAALAGRQVAVNHEFREKPIFKTVRERVVAREFGRLVFAQVWQQMSMPPWQEKTPWRAAMANRTLLEGGVHLVDLLIGLFGELPEAVYARHSAGYHGQPDADPVQVLTLEFGHGRLALITIDRLCQAGTSYLELRADCERASLRASLGGRAAMQIGKKRAHATGVRFEVGLGGLAWAEQGLHRRTLARASRRVGVDATAALLRDILAALRADRTPPSSGQEARDGLVVIEAAYESA